MIQGVCTVEGCTKPRRSGRCPYCEMHYYRLRRGGTLERRRKPKSHIVHSNDYILRYAPGHPLAVGNYVYEHRAVLYAARGDGPFTCYWCGKEITWANMDVDHLNGNRHDNRPENLVPSCPTCNRARSKAKLKETLRRRYGITFRGETLTLNEWARRIGVAPESLRWRLKHGWPVEKALTEPRGKFGPRPRGTQGGNGNSAAAGS